MFGDIRSEDEKLAYALDLAFLEISKDKGEVDDGKSATVDTSVVNKA